MRVESWCERATGEWSVSLCDDEGGEIENLGFYGDEKAAWKAAQNCARAHRVSAVRRDRAGQMVAVVGARIGAQ